MPGDEFLTGGERLSDTTSGVAERDVETTLQRPYGGLPRDELGSERLAIGPGADLDQSQCLP